MYYATELFIKKGGSEFVSLSVMIQDMLCIAPNLNNKCLVFWSVAMGTIWLAATLWKKVNKKVVIESDIKELCSQVQEPPKPLAISTLAKLLFGIVKMHEYRVTVVLKKANESYIKVVKRVDRNINLQGTQLAANTDAITMVERPMGHFEDLQDIDIDIMDLQMKEPDFTMESAILRKPHHDLLGIAQIPFHTVSRSIQ